MTDDDAIPILLDQATAPEAPRAYVLGRDGYYLRKKNGYYSALVKVKTCSSAPALEERVEFDFPPVPKLVLDQIAAFLRKVWELHASEGMTILHLSEDRQRWGWTVPTQRVSGAAVEYDNEPPPPGFRPFGTVHSHANFGAFQSGTDADDEVKGRFDGVHVTIGNLGSFLSYHARLILAGQEWEVAPGRLLEGLEAPALEVEAELLARVTKKEFAVVDGLFGDYRGVGEEPPKTEAELARKGHVLAWQKHPLYLPPDSRPSSVAEKTSQKNCRRLKKSGVVAGSNWRAESCD